MAEILKSTIFSTTTITKKNIELIIFYSKIFFRALLSICFVSPVVLITQILMKWTILMFRSVRVIWNQPFSWVQMNDSANWILANFFPNYREVGFFQEYTYYGITSQLRWWNTNRKNQNKIRPTKWLLCYVHNIQERHYCYSLPFLLFSRLLAERWINNWNKLRANIFILALYFFFAVFRFCILILDL